MKTWVYPGVLVIILLLASGCSRDPSQPSAATSSATTMPAPGGDSPAAALAGHWEGDAAIIVQWVKQRQLPIVLDIAPDGRVSGSVGDAKLVDARFVPNPLGRKLRIHGRLEGNLVDAEQVHREAVDILVERGDDRTLTGGLHSSGAEFGGKSSMKLSAADMVLRREAARAATAE